MSIETMKMALEAYLDREMPAGTIIGDPKWWTEKIAQVASQALANQALDKKAENARELGLDYAPEPVACIIDGDLYYHHEIDWEDLAYQGHGVELLYTHPQPIQEHAEQLAKLNWQYVECPACGSEGAKAFPKPADKPYGFFQYDIRLDAWVQNRHNNKGVAFYTSQQPQKHWVSLTDEEVNGFHNWKDCTWSTNELVRYVEAKLKEKNNG